MHVAPKKRVRRSADEGEHNGAGQNDVKPAVKEEQVIGVDADSQYADNGRVECGDWMETYGGKESWEVRLRSLLSARRTLSLHRADPRFPDTLHRAQNEIKDIDTLEQEPTGEHTYGVRIIWHDDSFSIVPLAFARTKCVQTLLDFMVSHLTFKITKKDEDDGEARAL